VSEPPPELGGGGPSSSLGGGGGGGGGPLPPPPPKSCGGGVFCLGGGDAKARTACFTAFEKFPALPWSVKFNPYVPVLSAHIWNVGDDSWYCNPTKSWDVIIGWFPVVPYIL